MRILGRKIRFIGAKIATSNAYVGVYHSPSKRYTGRHFFGVSPIPFVTFQFLVNKVNQEYEHRDPVSPQGWFEDGVTWGDQ